MQLLTYTVMEGEYQDGNGKLMNVQGSEDAVPADPSATPPVAGSVGTVGNPTQSAILIESDKSDPVVFSFVYTNSEGTKELRMLLVTIVTPSPPGVPSTQSFYSLLVMGPNGDWVEHGTNVELTSGGTKVAKNPHGVAQIGNMLYIIDYDTRMIYLLDGNALYDQKGGTYAVSAFDIGSEAFLPENARGQALIALNNSLFALYLNSAADGKSHYPGILVRVEVSGQNNTTLNYSAQTQVGRNPQMIIPINPSSGSPILLIPAIGGMQHDEGVGNYGESNITKVSPFDNWGSAATPILVSNAPSSVPIPEPNTPPAVCYTLDIQAIAASGDPGGNEIVYILSGIYQGDWDPNPPGTITKKYALWKTTVGDLNTLDPNTTVLDAYTDQKLSLAESCEYPGYFWDIFYENKGTGQVGRLWFLRGSPIIVSEAADYGAGSIFFCRGTAAGQIGGKNVNSVDLTSEAARQVQAAVSLKRGLLAHKPAIRAAKAAPTIAAEEEEE
jgi:hypothetical protein